MINYFHFYQFVIINKYTLNLNVLSYLKYLHFITQYYFIKF